LDGQSTLNSRIVNGLNVISNMDIIQIIFGTSYNDVHDFVSVNRTRLDFSESVLVYYSQKRLFLNTFSDIIFHYGICGLFFFLRTFKKKLTNPLYKAKQLVIMNLVAIFGQSIFFNPYYFQITMMLIIYEVDCTAKMNKNNEYLDLSNN
jgi:hypothetical protein